MERVQIMPRSYPTNLLQKDWTKRKCFYFQHGVDFIHKVHEMQVRHDDVWLVTLPKCGTTWMQELLWLVLNDYDFEGAQREHLELRAPFLEFECMLNENLETSLKPVEELRSPRLIKTHLPLPLLPSEVWNKKPKLVYVYRNPKDALVSGYYHSRSLGYEMDITCEQSLEDYMESSSLKCQPFEHVTEFYALRHEPWIFYTSFECMKSDLKQVIQQVVEFLNKSITEKQMNQMLQHLSFESMRNNPTTNHHWENERIHRLHSDRPSEHHNFVRKGQVGGYREELSPAFIEKCDKWIEEQLHPYNLTMDELLLRDEGETHKKNN